MPPGAQLWILNRMTRWFYLSPFTLVTGFTVGLWVLLMCSPFLRHTFWYFSMQGRRSTEFTPPWTRMDFDNYLTFFCGWWGKLLAKLLECTACQSIHAGTFAVFSYVWLINLCPIFHPVIFLMLWGFFVAVFYYLFKKLNHG